VRILVATRHLYGLLLAAGLAVLAGCTRSGKAGITLAGSTSVEPFAERLAELYMQKHPGIKVSVQGGGSSAGIRAIQNKICEIGMSSRELKPEEKGLNEIPIAHDAIALIGNVRNRLPGITLKQARDVFAGRIRNWRQLGGEDMPITVITREEGSGTRASFEEQVMTAGEAEGSKPAPEPFAADALVQDSNGAVREIVAEDPQALGYISFGLVDERVRALSLDGVEPSNETVRSGQYSIVRRFLFLTNGEPTGPTKSFVDYVLSPDGQKCLVEEGLISVE
jgi:phosphate transport system substrate-binding protein